MGYNTWQSIGKPLPNRLNIVLSRSRNIENQPNVVVLRSVEDALTLSKYLNCDLFIIGGANTYENFASAIEKWIVTEVPVNVEDADTFMAQDFLAGFEISETKPLSDNLNVNVFHRMPL
jgi:dihydrofolate reductase